jgi:hypothetical protein
MIEAAVCLFLIAVGIGTWAFAVVCRRVYGQPRPPGAPADESFLARLFRPQPVGQRVPVTEDRRPEGRDYDGTR